jgi:Putative Ig domain
MRSSTVFRWHRLPTLFCAAMLAAFSFATSAQAANVGPTISGTPPTTATVGSPYTFTPNAYDADGDKLYFDVRNKPSWATFDSSIGRLYGTPNAVGTWTNIKIRVSDGRRAVWLAAFQIKAVAATNSAPTISGTPATTVVAGAAYNFTPAAQDANGDPLTFSITGKPAWATFNTTTGNVSGTPTTAQVGTYSSIVIQVSDGKATTSLPAFSINVTAPATNRAPTISGTPPTSIEAGKAYTFTPTASDADQDTLGFTIQNLPTWATFSTSTGKLSGTPTAASVGSYGNVVISVSDGKATASLPAFTINVTAAPVPTTGSASLSWTPPTQNTDGTSLTNLAGYRISYGTSASALTQTIQIANPGISTYLIEDLAAGDWYFAVSAYASSGAASANSSVVSKTIP